jgi:nitric oxide reductase subunit B
VKDYSSGFSVRRLWQILIGGMVVMFATLLYFGGQIYQVAPPIPREVRTESGAVLYRHDDIERGQNVWQRMGGMEQGSIWGHGSYLAPDWSADWLHREASALLQRKLAAGADEAQARQQVRNEMRANRFDANTGVLTLSTLRAAAVADVQQHFHDLLMARTDAARALRRAYAMPVVTTVNDAEADAVAAFYFWTAWAAAAERPGDTISYTSNWPHEPLVGNQPTGAVFLWTFLSILLLLASIGAIVWYYARMFDVWRRDLEPESGYAVSDLITTASITPSMRATAKFFWLVCALFAVQIVFGIITAHYAVEGQGLYGLPLAGYYPYAITRTWHTQLAVVWIATAWLATGLYAAPLLSGHEPAGQRALVNFLFISLLIIAVGSFAGEWLAVNGKLRDLTQNFWFGHQGYEYLDLGRFWQIYLFIGLLLWVALILRALRPLLRAGPGSRSLLLLVIVATVSIGLLYGAGLLWGQHTHISIMEYWRWWVVHLWVEGVFEVFATAVVSLLLVRMGMLRQSTATTSVLLATIIFLFGGVLGTFHHLYFSGTPVAVIALGATFSALEVVPLMVVGFEAYNRAKLEHQKPWQQAYEWPFRFFTAVLFWNLVGAGLLGFLINPPLALYYMQGLNTTAAHGHAALFGVYGMLGIGLMLYCLRGLTDPACWNQRLLKLSFWCLNTGLLMMLVFSLLPQGLWQAWVSYSDHYAAARDPALLHRPLMEALVWARVPGDVVFSVGVAALVLFVWRAFRHQQHPDQMRQ